MYCRKCGAECKETDRFCVKCGSSLNEEDVLQYTSKKYTENRMNYKRIAIVLECIYFPLILFFLCITLTDLGTTVTWAGRVDVIGISQTTKVCLIILDIAIMAAIFLLLYVDKQTRGEKCKIRHYVITVLLFLYNMYCIIEFSNGLL